MSSPECHKSGTLPLSPGSLGGDEHAANRFYLEDLAIGLMRKILNIDVER